MNMIAGRMKLGALIGFASQPIVMVLENLWSSSISKTIATSLLTGSYKSNQSHRHGC